MMYLEHFLHIWDMHVAKQIIWWKKLEEYDENPTCTHFEKQYGQLIPLDVCSSTSNIVCMQLACPTTRDADHI